MVSIYVNTTLDIMIILPFVIIIFRHTDSDSDSECGQDLMKNTHPLVGHVRCFE